MGRHRKPRNRNSVSEKQLRHCVEVARANWRDWQDVFEHKSAVDTNPLLSDHVRFSKFCKEYSVGRTIRHGKRDEFRLELVKSIQDVVRDETGQALDRYEEKLRPRFGVHRGTRRMVSVLSKVPAFISPGHFLAWDRFAKKGVNIALGRARNHAIRTYAEYLEAFDRVFRGQRGRQIRAFVVRHRRSGENATCFGRRVLDMWLMTFGGREMKVGRSVS